MKIKEIVGRDHEWSLTIENIKEGDENLLFRTYEDLSLYLKNRFGIKE